MNTLIKLYVSSKKSIRKFFKKVEEEERRKEFEITVFNVVNLITTDAKKHKRSVADIIYLTETIRNVSEQHLSTILENHTTDVSEIEKYFKTKNNVR